MIIAQQQRRRLRAVSIHLAAEAAESSLLPLRVDTQLRALPEELQRVHAAITAASEAQDFRQAAALQDLLHVVEAKPALSVDDCCPSPEDALEFFLREGFVCVRNVLNADQLQRLQAQWRQAQEPIRALWDEAKLIAGNFIGEDFQPEERFAHIPHGRLWFDMPLPQLFQEAAGGDPVMLDIIDPPRLVQILEQIIGPDVRLVGIQPRTVPPEQNQGYTTWHRDGIQPPSHWPHPHARIVKAFVHVFDVAEDQACTSVVRGSHLMPEEWGSASTVYDLSSAGFKGFGGSSKDRTVDDGYAPNGSIANHVKFAAKAGDCCIFDIASASVPLWHPSFGFWA
jgi:hypothetical protein